MSATPPQHARAPNGLRLDARTVGGAVVVGGVALGLLAASAADGLDGAGRERLVRYVGILISAALAIGTPYLVYPDPAAGRLQLVNPGADRLLARVVRRMIPVVGALAVPPLVIGWGGGDVLLGLEGAVAAAAVGLYAVARFAPLGLRVGAWERGEAGGWYRTLRTWAPPLQFQVPEPLVPSLLATGETFLFGSVLAILGRALGAGWGLAVPVAGLGLAGVVLLRRGATFDRAFWTSNGVWTDAFRPSSAGEDAREALAYDAVYWAPPRFRPTVWAGLLSLDRRLPLGRLALGGLALVAAVAFAGAPGSVVNAALTLWTVAVNGAVALTARPALVPPALALRLHGGAGWTAARFLMNVRWLPLLAAALALLAWLTDLEVGEIVVWSIVYLLVAVASAALVTVAERFAFRRALA